MLVTFGHGTAAADQIAGLLRGAGVAAVVDIRTAPGSRRNPHVARAELERWLPEAGIGYRWEKRLGGFRAPPAGLAGHGAAGAGLPRLRRAHAQAGFLAAIDEVLGGRPTGSTRRSCAARASGGGATARLVADFVSVARGAGAAPDS